MNIVALLTGRGNNTLANKNILPVLNRPLLAYPCDAAKNVNIEVSKGEILGLVGESGSGKSTLLNIIAGLETIDEGHVLIDDYGKNVKEWKQNKGMPIKYSSANQTIAALKKMGYK